jgi:hypothetical protein
MANRAYPPDRHPSLFTVRASHAAMAGRRQIGQPYPRAHTARGSGTGRMENVSYGTQYLPGTS